MKNNKNKNIKKAKSTILPYSEESINLKLKILYILSLGLKVAILVPFFNIILRQFISKKILYFAINSSTINLLISLLLSILFAILTTKKQFTSDPIFLDDKIIVSNRQKSNGSYENIYLSKFVLLLSANIIFIIPLTTIIGLIASSVAGFILGVINISTNVILLLKYLITILVLKILSNSFNKPLIIYLKNKKDNLL